MAVISFLPFSIHSQWILQKKPCYKHNNTEREKNIFDEINMDSYSSEPIRSISCTSSNVKNSILYKNKIATFFSLCSSHFL